MGKLLQCRELLLRTWVEMPNKSKSDKSEKNNTEVRRTGSL